MLPHITNSHAGRNKYEVLYKNIFEVYFDLPELLKKDFGQDSAILTEHVLSISGLNNLDKVPSKFLRPFLSIGVLIYSTTPLNGANKNKLVTYLPTVVSISVLLYNLFASSLNLS